VFIEGSHGSWGFIIKRCGKQEVEIHGNTRLSSLDATIVAIVFI
jgi:hypothetical protein